MHRVPPTTPIIVGIGEVRNKETDSSQAIEPVDLILQAIQRAFTDASLSKIETALADSISVVPPWTWAYPDLPALLAERLQLQPSHLRIGDHGGNQPALLCDEAARRISVGESQLAIITGGEALASLAACRKSGKLSPTGWTKPDPSQKAVSASDLSFIGQNVASRHSMGLAIHIYPMYENGLRAYTQQTQKENHEESAALYAEFDKIACAHPYSWRSGENPRNAKVIGTVSGRNRMICTPYPLLMNAFNTVNLAAACILTSVENAERIGIPQDKWIYVLGGAGTNEKENFWERPNYYSSSSLGKSIDGAIAASGLGLEEVGCFDIYSCFPIVPKLACKHMGMSVTGPSKPISLLGGLTSFGGAGNNYSMHAIIEMTRQLRKRSHRNGLVLANGGLLTHHHAICLSSEPRKDFVAYAQHNPLPGYVEESHAPPFDEQAEGDAVIETYTVAFDRQGRPQLGHIVGRLVTNGHRFLANHGSSSTLQTLANPNVEPIGLHGFVCQDNDGRNLFHLKEDCKL